MPTFDTPEPIAVTLELGVGDVRIDATDRTDTTVEVRPSDPSKEGDVAAAEQTQVEYRNGQLSVRGPKGWRQWMPRRGGESIDVQIEVPAGSRVELDAGVATLRGTGSLGAVHGKVGVGEIRLDRTGSLDVRSGFGDISVDHVAGKADVSTGSGTLRIGTIDGHVVLKNSNGDTWIGEVSGTARVSAANGDIAIDVARAGVRAKTANGAVRLGEVAAGDAVAQTAAGDLEVGVRDGVAAWLDLHTAFGHVRNDLEASGAPATGDATVSVHASTSYGDISVHRSSASEGRGA
jgi:Putative adhesin